MRTQIAFIALCGFLAYTNCRLVAAADTTVQSEGGSATTTIEPEGDYDLKVRLTDLIDLNENNNEEQPSSSSSSHNLRGLQASKTCLTMPTNRFFHIVSAHSGFTISVANGSLNNNANIVQGPISGSRSDNWKFEPTVDGYYHIINDASGKAINVQYGSTANSGNVQQFVASSVFKSDDWCFQDAGNGNYYIQAHHSGLVMDVAGHSTSLGGNIHQWKNYGTANQQWKLVASDGCLEMPKNEYFHITARHSGLSINVAGASKANGANIVQSSTSVDNPATSDNWKFVPEGGGYYHIINENSGKAINVSGGSTANGANIQQYQIQPQGNDEWCFQDAGSNFYFIRARHSGKVIDVGGNLKNEGVSIHQWAKTGVANQQWKIAFSSGCAELSQGAYYHITARHSGLSLNVAGASKANSANIVQSTTSKMTKNDNWRVQAAGNGYYHIINENSGKAINVSGGSTANGANIQQYQIQPQGNDEWCFQDAGSDFYFIRARHSGKMIDVGGNLKNEGVSIHQWAKTGVANQQFKVASADACAKMPTGTQYHIISRSSGFALDVAGASKNNKANIIQSPLSARSPKTSDNWSLYLRDNGYYNIVNENSGKVVSVDSQSLRSGANIHQWTENQALSNDDWCFINAGSGSYFIQAGHSGKMLDVAGNSKNPGTSIHQWASHGGTNQQWMMVPIDSSSSWEGPYGTPLIAAAAANLPDGRIMLWAAFSKFTTTSTGGSIGKTATSIFDPVSLKHTEMYVVNTQHDMFCPGTATLPDGKLLVTGGANEAATSIYNPSSNTWSKGKNMNIPRGYHTMTTLANGNVFTLGGSWSGGSYGNRHGEMYDVENDVWIKLDGILSTGRLLTYDVMGPHRADNHMWLFTAPNGLVFHAGPSRRMHWIDTSGNGSVQASIDRGDDTDAMNGNAIMFDIGKILTVGGAVNYNSGLASNRAYVIDINNDKRVTVRKTGNMAHRRTVGNSVVLPSGAVIVIGGMPDMFIFSDRDSILAAEIWYPETGTFTQLASMKIPRNYHSSVILLKDGRVLAAGGGLCGGGCPANHQDLEILTPPYLINADGSLKQRPVIRSAPASLVNGDKFTVQMNTNADHTFAMVRTGAVTHSVNTDLRRIPLESLKIGNNRFSVFLPTSSAVCLPGTYFLFAMNSAGVPSIAATVSIGMKYTDLSDRCFGGGQCQCQDPTIPVPLVSNSNLFQQHFEDTLKQIVLPNLSVKRPVLMLGDSITERLMGTDFRGTGSRVEEKQIFDETFPPDSQAMGTASQTTVELLWQLQNGLLNSTTNKNDNVQTIIVLIGTNDLGRGCSKEVIATAIVNLVDYLRVVAKSSRIVIHGILPQCDRATRALGVQNERVEDVNSELQRISSEEGLFDYIENSELFLEDLSLLEDCVHPSLAGYERWIPQIAQKL